MHRFITVFLVFTAIAFTQGCATTNPATPDRAARDAPLTRFVQQSVADHGRHYRAASLVDLLPPLLLAGSLANTNADTWIRDSWQADARSEESDDVARVFLRVGDAGQNRISAPLYVLGMVAGDYTGYDDAPLATWASRSLRANILGGPQAFVLTYALGSHRPDAGSSAWNPMNDNDGVSGHSFYGAVPFLTAARMAENERWQFALYALSVLPAYARVNDNKHYTSQAVLGWSLAWLATRTVADEKTALDDVTVVPALLPDGAYVALSWTF